MLEMADCFLGTEDKFLFYLVNKPWKHLDVFIISTKILKMKNKKWNGLKFQFTTHRKYFRQPPMSCVLQTKG